MIAQVAGISEGRASFAEFPIGLSGRIRRGLWNEDDGCWGE